MKKSLAYIIVSICVLALAFGGWRIHRQTRLRRFGAVKEGVLYRSGQPTEKQFERIVDEYGIKTVVNLRSNPEPYEAAFAAKRGLKAVAIPMSHTEPLSNEWVKTFLDLIDNPENHPILVHCSEGQTRAGAMIALYRTRRSGWSRERTIEEMKRYEFNFAERHNPLMESVLTLPKDTQTPKAADPKPKAKPTKQDTPAE